MLSDFNILFSSGSIMWGVFPCLTPILYQFLLCLSNTDALVPVMTVYLGEAANFTCDLPGNHDSSGEHFWYKQTTGDTLEVIVKFVNYANPQYGTHYSDSRIKSVITDKMSILTILDTAIEDEGMYHCVFTDWQTNIWHGTYLLIKGNVFIISRYFSFFRIHILLGFAHMVFFMHYNI